MPLRVRQVEEHYSICQVTALQHCRQVGTALVQGWQPTSRQRYQNRWEMKRQGPILGSVHTCGTAVR